MADLSTGGPAAVRATTAHGVRLQDGVGAGQADISFHDTRTILASGNEDLDLAGVLVDALGATITAVRIKLIYVRASVGNVTDIVVGNAAANAWATFLSATGTITLRPGASIMAIADETDATGWTVTAGTGDLLRVTNSGGTDADYDIILVGASA